jgi:hypothetical protein
MLWRQIALSALALYFKLVYSLYQYNRPRVFRWQLIFEESAMGSMLDPRMEKALRKYARVVREGGWEAGEPIIEEYKKKLPDFEKLALAIRIMMRADQILQEDREKEARKKSRKKRGKRKQ